MTTVQSNTESYPSERVTKKHFWESLNYRFAVHNLAIVYVMAIAVVLSFSSNYGTVFGKWLVSEGVHGYGRYPVFFVLCLFLILPSLNTTLHNGLGIACFSVARGIAIGVSVMLLFKDSPIDGFIGGDLLNRDPYASLLLGGFLCLAVLATTPIPSIFTTWVLHEQLRLEIHAVKKSDAKWKLSDFIAEYFHINEPAGFIAYCGTFRRSKPVVSVLGQQKLSTNIIDAYASRTDYFSKLLVDSDISDGIAQDLFRAFKEEVNICHLARKTGIEIDASVLLNRARINFLVATYSFQIGQGRSPREDDMLSDFLRLLAELALDARDSKASKLEMILEGFKARDPKIVFEAAFSQFNSRSAEDKTIFLRAVAAICLERMHYVGWALQLTENTDKNEHLKRNLEDEDMDSWGALAFAQSRIKHRYASAHDSIDSGKFVILWKQAFDAAKRAGDYKAYQLCSKQRKIEKEEETFKKIDDSSSSALDNKKLFGYVGSGNYLSFFLVISLLLITAAIFLWPVTFKPTWHASTYPGLSDPFRPENNIYKTDHFSAEAVGDEIFIGTKDGLHVIDTETYAINTEVSSTGNVGPQYGDLTQLSGIESGDLAIQITQDRANNRGLGLDLRNANGDWHSIIAAHSEFGIHALHSKVEDIAEVNDVDTYFLIDKGNGQKGIYKYDFLKRRLSAVSVNAPNNIISIEPYNNDVLVLYAVGTLKYLINEELDLSLATPHKEPIAEIHTFDKSDPVLVRTNRGRLYKAQNNFNQWELLLGGEQWNVDFQDQDSVKFAGFDSSRRHLCLIVEKEEALEIGLRSEGSRYWTLHKFPETKIIKGVNPAISPSGNALMVATNKGLKLLTQGFAAGGYLDLARFTWKDVEPNWKPMNMDINDSGNVVVTLENPISSRARVRVMEFDFDGLSQEILDHQEMPDTEFVYANFKGSNSEIIEFVDKLGNYINYDIGARQIAGGDERGYQGYYLENGAPPLIENRTVKDIAVSELQKIILDDAETLYSNRGSKQSHQFNPRDEGAIVACWDLPDEDGFEIITTSGKSWEYSLTKGWSPIFIASELIDTENIQRRSDDSLVALSEDGEHVLIRDWSKGWLDATSPEEFKFDRIIPSTSETLLQAPYGDIYKLDIASRSLVRIKDVADMPQSENWKWLLESEIELPIVDAIDVNNKLWIADQEGILKYLPDSGKQWSRVDGCNASDYQLFEHSYQHRDGSTRYSLIAWSEEQGHLFQIINEYLDPLPLLDGLTVTSIDFNNKNEFVALTDDGQVWTMRSESSLPERMFVLDQGINSSKCTAATSINDGVVVLAEDSLYFVDGSTAVVRRLAQPQSSDTLTNIASADNLLFALTSKGTVSYRTIDGSWKLRSFPSPVTRIIELEHSVLALCENKSAYLLYSDRSRQEIFSGVNDSTKGVEFSDNSAVCELNGSVYIALEDSKGILKWNEKSPAVISSHDDQIIDLVEVDGRLFAIGESLTWSINVASNKCEHRFNFPADKIYKSKGTISYLYGGVIYTGNKVAKRFERFEETLDKIVDVIAIKNNPRDTLLIENNGGIVQYSGKTRTIERVLGGDSSYAVDRVQMLSPSSFLIAKQHVDNNMFLLEVINLPLHYDKPRTTLDDVIKYEVDDKGVIVAIHKDKRYYEYNGSRGQYFKVRTRQFIHTANQVKNFIPFGNDAVVLSNNKLWFYNSFTGHSKNIKPESSIYRIWKWDNQSLLAHTQSRLIHISIPSFEERVVGESINSVLSQMDENHIVWDDMQQNVFELVAPSTSPIEVEVFSESRYEGGNTYSARSFADDPNRLFVFDRDYKLYSYWADGSSWTPMRLGTPAKDINVPVIARYEDDGYCVVHQEGVLTDAYSYESFLRPTIGFDHYVKDATLLAEKTNAIAWIDDANILRVNGDVQPRPWENETMYAWGRGSKRSISADEIRVYQSREDDKTCYFVLPNTVFKDRLWSKPIKINNQGIDTYATFVKYALDARHVIGESGIFLVYKGMSYMGVFLDNGENYYISDPRLKDVAVGSMRDGRATFTQASSVNIDKSQNATTSLFQMVLEIQDDGQSRLAIRELSQEVDIRNNPIGESVVYNYPNGQLAISLRSDFDTMLVKSDGEMHFHSIDTSVAERDFVLSSELKILFSEADEELFIHFSDTKNMYRVSEDSLEITSYPPRLETLEVLTPSYFVDQDSHVASALHVRAEKEINRSIDALPYMKLRSLAFQNSFIKYDMLKTFRALPIDSFLDDAGYLRFVARMQDYDINLHSGRYRFAEIRRIGTEESGRFVVELKNDQKSYLSNGARCSNDLELVDYSSEDGNFVRNNRGRFKRTVGKEELDLGVLKKDRAFMTDVMLGTLGSFVLGEDGFYFLDGDRNLWFSKNRRRSLVKTNCTVRSKLGFSAESGRDVLVVPTTGSTSRVYELQMSEAVPSESRSGELVNASPVQGEEGRLRWHVGKDDILDFELNVSQNLSRPEWRTLSFESGIFSHERPVDIVAHGPTGNSVLVYQYIIDGSDYYRTIDDKHVFYPNFLKLNPTTRTFDRVVDMAFGRARVARGKVAFEIPCSNGEWQSVLYAEGRFSCDHIRDSFYFEGSEFIVTMNGFLIKDGELITPPEADLKTYGINAWKGELHVLCFRGTSRAEEYWKFSNGAFFSKIDYSDSSFYNLKQRWKGDDSSNLDAGEGRVGFAYLDHKVNWSLTSGLFNFQIPNVNLPDPKLIRSSKGIVSMNSDAGRLSFTRYDNNFEWTVRGDTKPLPEKLITSNGKIEFDPSPSGALWATYKNVPFLGTEKRGDFAITWSVKNGLLSENHFADVAIDNDGSIFLLSKHKIAKYGTHRHGVSDTRYIQSRNGERISHPKDKSLSKYFLANALHFDLSFSKVDYSAWQNSDNSKNNYVREYGRINLVRSSKRGFDSVTFELDDVPLRIDHTGFAFDKKQKEIVYDNGRLLLIQNDRILALDRNHNIRSATRGGRAIAFDIAIDEKARLHLRGLSDYGRYEIFRSVDDYKSPVSIASDLATYRYASYNFSEPIFRVMDSSVDLSIEWTPGSKAFTYLFEESDGIFDHDRIFGIEFISGKSADRLLTTGVDCIAKRDRGTYKLLFAKKFDNLNNRKIVSDTQHAYITDGKKYNRIISSSDDLSLEPIALTSLPIYLGQYSTDADWEVVWDINADLKLELATSNNEMLTPSGPDFPGDKILGAAYDANERIVLCSDFGLRDIQRNLISKDNYDVTPYINQENVGVSIARTNNAHVLYSIHDYWIELTEQLSRTPRTAFISQPSVESSEISLSWSAGSPKFTINSSSVSSVPYTLDLQKKGFFDIDFASSLDVVHDENKGSFPLILHDTYSVLTRMDAKLENASKPYVLVDFVVKDLSGHFVYHDNNFSKRVAGEPLINATQGKLLQSNTGKYLLLDIINLENSLNKTFSEEPLLVLSEAENWRLYQASSSQFRIVDKRYRGITEGEKFFYKGQLASDVVQNVLSDSEKIWINTRAGMEELAVQNVPCDLKTIPLDLEGEYVATPPRILEKLEDESWSHVFSQPAYVFELGSNTWSVELNAEIPVRWIRHGDQWQDKRNDEFAQFNNVTLGFN